MLFRSVFSIGNPLLDISAHVDAEYLKKYNLLPANAILAGPEHLPIYPDIIQNYNPEYSAGGAAQNTCRGLTWMLQTPNVATYVGCIGSDNYGEILESEAKKGHVNVKYLKDATTPTGTCAALIVNHDRSLVANLAAANNYKHEHFESEEIQAAVKKAKYIYSTGFFLTVSPQTLVELGKHAAETNKIFMLNLAAPFIIDFFTDSLKNVLPYADIVVGNETEGQAFGKKFFNTEDLKETAQKLAAYEKINNSRKRTVVITRAGDPAYIIHDGEFFEHPAIPLDDSLIVDTNGAGDSYSAGFLAGLILGKDISVCANAGNYCAREILQVGGVVYRGVPSFKFD